jgi:formylglycine-generating enzyme required for sulfatase activity
MRAAVRGGLLLVFFLAAACGEGEHEDDLSVLPLTPEDTMFVSVPGGTFTNSSGETVEVPAFQMLRTEVNNRLYRHIAAGAGLDFPMDPGFPGMENYFFHFPDHPVVNVTPSQAEAAAAALSCRLPSRDQWEYAASRGLTGSITRQFPWGSLSPPEVPGIPANYLALDSWDTRDADGFAYTAPCGSYPLSDGGFADIAGNVAEMVFCGNDSSYHAAGGSWVQGEDAMRMGSIRPVAHGDLSWYIGFRLVR